ncbi:MAG: PKD domain-containing protein [Spirochaetales bacterium]|nr:PKD domain-containing protein [Spirochaetales bacterium]
MKRRILLPFVFAVLSLVLVSCPYAIFTIEIVADPDTGPAPLTVGLMASYDETRHIDSCYWIFGDGTADVFGPASSYYLVTHVFEQPGTYWVTCMATEERAAGDLTAYDSVQITVADPVGGALRVTIDGDPLSNCPAGGPLVVYFTSTVSGGTPPYSYEWNFGDWIGSTEANPVHEYEEGPCDVVLTVTDDAAQSATSNTLTVEYCP